MQHAAEDVVFRVTMSHDTCGVAGHIPDCTATEHRTALHPRSSLFSSPRAGRAPRPDALLLLLALVPSAVAAQPQPGTTPVAPAHWAYEALDRLADAGLLHGEWAVGARPASENALAEAMRAAADVARAAGSRLAPFAAAAAERLAEELRAPASAGGCSPAAGARSYRAGLGALHAEGGFDEARAVLLHGRASIGVGCRFALFYEGEARSGSSGIALRHEGIGLAGRAAALLFYAGRERFRLGAGAGGSILLSDAVPLDGLVLGLESPVRLPGFLSRAGPVHAMLVASRIGGDTLGPEVGFVALRLTAAPHPRLQLGVNRSILFQTERDGQRPGLDDVLFMAIGKHTRFDDQRASFEARLRLDAAGWPVVAYLEWGLEDSAGADEDPALLFGVSLPVMPGLPALALRYEYTAFGEDTRLICPFCGGGYPRSWYRHAGPPRVAYADAAGTPLGHPLGGYGHEHRVEARAWPADARWRLRAAFAAIEREPGNLLYERKPGAGWSAAFGAAYRLGARVELEAAGQVERGRTGWREHRASVRLAAFF
nr:MAG: hypothetical protein DIU52_14950 [bacterium]